MIYQNKKIGAQQATNPFNQIQSIEPNKPSQSIKAQGAKASNWTKSQSLSQEKNVNVKTYWPISTESYIIQNIKSGIQIPKESNTTKYNPQSFSVKKTDFQYFSENLSWNLNVTQMTWVMNIKQKTRNADG